MKHISVFNNFINSTANEHEKEIASRFFSCGMLHAITGESCQVHSLLSANKREVPAPYNALTKADVDSLVSIVSSTIANLHEYEREYANDIAFVWDMCDDTKAEDITSSYNFALLNALKDERRGIKRHLKRLAAIQHKLKKYR